MLLFIFHLGDDKNSILRVGNSELLPKGGFFILSLFCKKERTSSEIKINVSRAARNYFFYVGCLLLRASIELVFSFFSVCMCLSFIKKRIKGRRRNKRPNRRASKPGGEKEATFYGKKITMA